MGNTAGMKPMLAGKLSSMDKLFFPCYVTPKLDGIRCLIVNGVAVSRSLKPIRNKYVQTMTNGLPDGLDGELMLEEKATFNEVSSAIMSEGGKPNFRYFVFDYFLSSQGYEDRMKYLDSLELHDKVSIVYPAILSDIKQFEDFERNVLADGFEGVMVRKGDGPYKFGRSTEREGYLLKVKRFTDAEAEVIGFVEQCHNDNVATTDNLGHTTRSQHKENLVPAGTLGALMCRDLETGIEFKVGTGFNEGERKAIWGNRKKILGLLAKYKYQNVGKKEAPRFPVWLGFRSKEDM